MSYGNTRQVAVFRDMADSARAEKHWGDKEGAGHRRLATAAQNDSIHNAFDSDETG